MYVWELVACRLRCEGWEVWHSTRHDACGPTYTVHLHRPGDSYEVCGPTLTEAYAAAARRVREPAGHVPTAPAPHFSRVIAGARY